LPYLPSLEQLPGSKTDGVSGWLSITAIMTNLLLDPDERVCRKTTQIPGKCRQIDATKGEFPRKAFLRIFAMSQACNILEAAAIYVASGDAQA
jgi:hypothetical protein